MPVNGPQRLPAGGPSRAPSYLGGPANIDKAPSGHPANRNAPPSGSPPMRKYPPSAKRPQFRIPPRLGRSLGRGLGRGLGFGPAGMILGLGFWYFFQPKNDPRWHEYAPGKYEVPGITSVPGRPLYDRDIRGPAFPHQHSEIWLPWRQDQKWWGVKVGESPTGLWYFGEPVVIPAYTETPPPPPPNVRYAPPPMWFAPPPLGVPPPRQPPPFYNNPPQFSPPPLTPPPPTPWPSTGPNPNPNPNPNPKGNRGIPPPVGSIGINIQKNRPPQIIKNPAPQRPPRGTREKKAKSKGITILLNLLDEGSEGAEILRILTDNAGIYGGIPLNRALEMFFFEDYWKNFDVVGFAKDAALNEIEDQVIGRIQGLGWKPTGLGSAQYSPSIF